MFSIGANYDQLPVNAPKCRAIRPTNRDGPMCFSDNSADLPNYWPNSFLNVTANPKYTEHREPLTGDVYRHNGEDDDDFSQSTNFWNKVLKADERQRLIENISAHLIKAQPFIQERQIANFEKVHPDLGNGIRVAMKKIKVKIH